MHQNNLDVDGWNLSKQEIKALLDKIKSTGKKLDNYINGKVFRGIITGLNEAFVIERSLKASILNEESDAVFIKLF